VEVKVFGPQDLATSTTAPLTIADGECLGPSLVLDGRAGFLRCRPRQGATPSAVLDPCEPAPYDGSLVGCLPDPTGVPTLLRVDAASTEEVGAAAAPPPFRLLVLDGGDRCLPIPAPEPPPAPPPAGGDGNRRVGGRDGATTSSSSTSTPSTTDGPSRRQQTTTSAPTSSTSTSTTVPATTVASTTTAAPTTTVPIAERSTYTCVSGAVIVGLPDSSSPTWTATVRQEGLADRRLPVIQAFS
jgi:hypothetical protein